MGTRRRKEKVLEGGVCCNSSLFLVKQAWNSSNSSLDFRNFRNGSDLRETKEEGVTLWRKSPPGKKDIMVSGHWLELDCCSAIKIWYIESLNYTWELPLSIFSHVANKPDSPLLHFTFSPQATQLLQLLFKIFKQFISIHSNSVNFAQLLHVTSTFAKCIQSKSFKLSGTHPFNSIQNVLALNRSIFLPCNYSFNINVGISFKLRYEWSSS